MPEDDAAPDADLQWLQEQLAQLPINIVEHDPLEEALKELFEVVEEGNAERAGELLVDLPTEAINMIGPEDDTLLHLACLYGHKACVQLLLQHGAAVDVRDEDEGTVLHDAGASGDVAIVKLILAAGPGLVTAVDSDGDTPLHNAARGGHEDAVACLLAAGADPLARNGATETPLKTCGKDVTPALSAMLVAAEAKQGESAGPTLA